MNSRINYPIKAVLVQMEQTEVIDMRNDVHKFAVSWVTIRLISSPLHTFIQSWNCHTIPGRNGGIPNNLAVATRQIIPLQTSVVPSVVEAVNIHESNGSRLTHESTFGFDPIGDYDGLQKLRERDFFARYPSMDIIFSDVLHSNGEMLVGAIQFFISLSEHFATVI